MLIPITKKYIIKHTFGNIDYPFYNSREEFIEKYIKHLSWIEKGVTYRNC